MNRKQMYIGIFAVSIGLFLLSLFLTANSGAWLTQSGEAAITRNLTAENSQPSASSQLAASSEPAVSSTPVTEIPDEELPFAAPSFPDHGGTETDMDHVPQTGDNGVTFWLVLMGVSVFLMMITAIPIKK